MKSSPPETGDDTPGSTPSGPLDRFALVWLACAAFAGSVVALCLYRDFGVTWDEGIQAEYGRRVLAYFASGFSDTACNELHDTRFYGPLVDLLGALLSRDLPVLDFSRRHLLTALLGVLTVLGVGCIALPLRSRIVVVVATLATAFNPILFGHSFFNTKDIPFACAVVWTLAFFTRWAEGGRTRWLMATSIALGLSLGVRVGGLPLLAAILLTTLLLAKWLARREPSECLASRKWSFIAGSLGVMAAIVWAIIILPWPWAHASPLRHPLEAIAVAFRFPKRYPVLFGGEYIMSDQLPHTYLLVFLAITTPIPILALAAAGAVSAVRGLTRAPRSLALRRALALLWVLIPVALFTVLKPNVYDGTRHFLFVLPGLAVLAGIGAERLLARLDNSRLRAIALGALVLLLLQPSIDMARLHPYQYAYYNELVGGSEGAYRRFENDYWLASYREAAQWINEQTRADLDAGRTIRVLAAGNDLSAPCLLAFLDPRIEANFQMKVDVPGDLPEGINYYVGTTRYELNTNFPDARVAHVIDRTNAVYSVVKVPGGSPP